MDDYKKTLITKLDYVRMMISILGVVKLPYDWFDVCWTEKKPDNAKLHDCNTIFKMTSLLSLYPDETNAYLTKHNISKSFDEKVFTFRKNV